MPILQDIVPDIGWKIYEKMANSLNGGCARDGGNAYNEDDGVIGGQGVNFIKVSQAAFLY